MLARPAREITELGGAEKSFLRMRGNSDAPEGIGDPGKLLPQNERELPFFFFFFFALA